MKTLINIGAIIVVVIIIFYVFIYEKPGPMEEFGSNVDERIEKIQHGDETSMEKAGRKTREAMDSVKKEIK